MTRIAYISLTYRECGWDFYKHRFCKIVEQFKHHHNLFYKSYNQFRLEKDQYNHYVSIFINLSSLVKESEPIAFRKRSFKNILKTVERLSFLPCHFIILQNNHTCFNVPQNMNNSYT